MQLFSPLAKLDLVKLNFGCPTEQKKLENKSSLAVQLLQSCKAVAHGSNSQSQCTASCKAPSARPSAAQTAQKAQQMEVPQPTADDTSSSQSQPLSGSSLSAPPGAALQKLSPEMVATHEQQQQPSCVPGKGLSNTLSQQTAELLCNPAIVNGQGESGSLQHGTAGMCQEHSCDSASDVRFPQTAAAEAKHDDMCSPSVDPLQNLAAAMLWHRDAVFPHQYSGLQIHVGAQLADTEEVSGTPSQSSSEVDAERMVQQSADSCSCAAGSAHLGQLQMEGSTSDLSSNGSECASSAELGAVAADGDKQDALQPSMFDTVPISSWNDRPSSSDHSLEACSGDLMLACQQVLLSNSLHQQRAVCICCKACPCHDMFCLPSDLS